VLIDILVYDFNFSVLTLQQFKNAFRVNKEINFKIGNANFHLQSVEKRKKRFSERMIVEFYTETTGERECPRCFFRFFKYFFLTTTMIF